MVQEVLSPGVQHSQEADPCAEVLDRKSTRLNSSHLGISYAVFCLKKKNKVDIQDRAPGIAAIRPETIRPVSRHMLDSPHGAETNLNTSPQSAGMQSPHEWTTDRTR